MLEQAQKIMQEAGNGQLSTLVYYPKYQQHSDQLAELTKDVQKIKKEARKDVVASITGLRPQGVMRCHKVLSGCACLQALIV